MLTKRNTAALLLSFAILFAAGCKKKAPAPPPPPAPAPPAPSKPQPKPPMVTLFEADPSTIERGQSSTLKWAVEGADSISIEPGIGTVQANGSRQVFPSSTTTYTLTANGPGGTDRKTATVTVNPPPPPPPPAPERKESFEDRLMRQVQDAFFDYDKSNVRDDARDVLTRNADALKAIFRDFPDRSVSIEGHCDERGSAEYNLGLGDRRSISAKEFLVQLGIPGDKLKTISYGKERPQCSESNEGCWQRNRRAHFAPAQ